MKCRKPYAADLNECLQIEPASIGAEIVGHEVALAIWENLFRSRCFNAVVIELPGQGAILGFGASVFVVPGFIAHELEDPKPFLNARILADIAAGHSPIHPERTLVTGQQVLPG